MLRCSSAANAPASELHIATIVEFGRPAAQVGILLQRMVNPRVNPDDNGVTNGRSKPSFEVLLTVAKK